MKIVSLPAHAFRISFTSCWKSDTITWIIFSDVIRNFEKRNKTFRSTELPKSFKFNYFFLFSTKANEKNTSIPLITVVNLSSWNFKRSTDSHIENPPACIIINPITRKIPLDLTSRESIFESAYINRRQNYARRVETRARALIWIFFHLTTIAQTDTRGLRSASIGRRRVLWFHVPLYRCHIRIVADDEEGKDSSLQTFFFDTSSLDYKYEHFGE